ncbi:hypothetical protein AO265_03880 [Pseudomonas sp. ABAC61]|nr:hypothetical protein AO265_03880 [Pseudomonas sp. ABAC61]
MMAVRFHGAGGLAVLPNFSALLRVAARQVGEGVVGSNAEGPAGLVAASPARQRLQGVAAAAGCVRARSGRKVDMAVRLMGRTPKALRALSQLRQLSSGYKG